MLELEDAHPYIDLASVRTRRCINHGTEILFEYFNHKFRFNHLKIKDLETRFLSTGGEEGEEGGGELDNDLCKSRIIIGFKSI